MIATPIPTAQVTFIRRQLTISTHINQRKVNEGKGAPKFKAGTPSKGITATGLLIAKAVFIKTLHTVC